MIDIFIIVLAIGIITVIYKQVAYEFGVVGRLVSRVTNSIKIKRIKYLIFFIMVLNVLTIAFLCYLHSSTDLEFLFLRIDSALLTYISLVVFAICLVIFSAVLLKEQKNKIKLLLPIILSFCIIACSTFSWVFTSSEDRYYKFYSPDKKYSFVVYEWSFLLGGGVEIYERIPPFFIKRLGVLGTDDGYRAIDHHDYSIEWDNNKFTLTIGKGNGYTNSETFELKNK